jgi:DNA modification methylase
MNKRDIKLETVYVDEKLLRFCEYNPRVFTDKAIDDLSKSINESGFVVPILANSSSNRKNIVIGGNLRLLVCRKLGINKIPVNFVEIENIEEEKRLNLALNRVAAEWDYEALKNFKIGMLLDIGFDEKDLTTMWSDVLSVDDDDFDPVKEAESIDEPQTKLGQIFQLGNHKLICGNSKDPKVIKQLVGNEKVSVINSDPVYNISYSYSKGLGKKDKYHAEVEDNRSEEDYKDLLKTTIQNGLVVSEDNVHCFYFCDQKYIGLLQTIYSELGLDNRRVCLWIKNQQNPTPQVAFSKCYEAIVYSTRGNPYLAPINNLNEILNREIGTGNRIIDDILDLLDIWLVKRLPTSEYEHPTSKPPSLYEKALRRCSKPNDIILDMFAGGGSQMVACEALKRRIFMVELEPRFCDVIIKRYELLTNNKAKLISEGGSDGNK